MLTFRRCALVCVIAGAHFLLIYFIPVSDKLRGAQRSEEELATLFFVDVPEPDDTQPSTRPISSYNPSLKNRAALENTITPPPQIQEADAEIEEADARIDWYGEASRGAADVVRRLGEAEKIRSFDHRPDGTDSLPRKPSRHKRGDSVHLEGGVIIDWIDGRCYYSNENGRLAMPAFAGELRLQLPTCKASGGSSFPSFEDWKKEQANR